LQEPFVCSAPGKGKGKNETCQAKGCTAPSRGWPLCNTCRREGLEKGSMLLKDGNKMPVIALDKKEKAPVVNTETRLANLEKKVMAAITSAKEQESDGDDELELFQGGAPKSVKIAAAEKKRKRELGLNVSIFDRMDRPAAKRCSTEQELDAEFEDEFCVDYE
jgi:hypothetical protein